MSSKSVPWGALTPLLVGRFSTAGAYACQFPFLPAMLMDMGLPTKRVSFWTGFAESSLMAAELVIAVPMSWLSDHFGRRPVLLASMLWTTVTCAMLGTSSTLTEVVIWRLLGGISGMRQVGRVMLGELSNELNRVRMFSAFVPSGTIGTIAGYELMSTKLIVQSHDRGCLCKTRGQDTMAGGDYSLAIEAIFAADAAHGCLPGHRTVPLDKHLKETKPVHLASSGSKPSLCQAIKQPGMLPLMVSFAVCQGLDHAYHAATALICSTPAADGGLGLAPDKIAILLSAMSVCYLLISPLALHGLSARYTKHQSLTILACFWLSVPPLYAAALRVTGNQVALYGCLALLCAARSVSGLCWAFFDINAIESSSPALLSSTNACITLLGGVGRLAGPISFGWLYSISLSFAPGSTRRDLIWLMLAVVSFLPLFLLRLSRQQKLQAQIDSPDETTALLQTQA